MLVVNKKITELFQSLSPNEQRLLIGVVILGVLFSGMLMVRKGQTHLANLDAQINNLQDRIVTSKTLMLRREAVETEYDKIAAQHSSAWTQEEIQDRLRAEIYRLAQMSPPKLAKDGRPVSLTNDSGELVSFPSLQQGILDEAEEGYREFALRMRIPNTKIDALTAFIERLQMSPQSLRIDGLELARTPTNDVIRANLLLTRTVVDGPPEGSVLSTTTAEGDLGELDAALWTAEGCSVSNEGEQLVAKHSGGDDAQVFLKKTLPTGATYELYLDAATQGDVQLGMLDIDDGTLLEGAQKLFAAADTLYRYRVQFTVPGNGGRRAMQVPVFSLESPGASLRLDTLMLRQVGGHNNG